MTHAKFHVDRSKDLGSTGTQIRVFPIDFDRRPYNSVTHYRATLWYSEGFDGKGASNESGVLENSDFRLFYPQYL